MDTSTHRPQIDGLRAVAALAVVAHHSLSHDSALLRVDPGNIGVRVFLVLSGFLISGILFDHLTSDTPNLGAIRAFYARRTLRIWPLYYLVVTVALVAFGGLRSHTGWLVAFAANLRTFLIDDWMSEVSHLWSIALEEQFYLVWPVVLAIAGPRRWRAVVAAACVGGVASRLITDRLGLSIVEFRMVPTNYADLFGLGAAAALWLRRQRPPRENVIRVGSVAFWFGLVMTVTATYLAPETSVASRHLMFLWHLALGIGAVLVAHAGLAGVTGRVLASGQLTYLGRISYGIYLWHLPIVGLLKIHAGFDYGPGLFTATAGLTVVVSTISWLVLERPVNALKSRFPYRPAPHRSLPHDPAAS